MANNTSSDVNSQQTADHEGNERSGNPSTRKIEMLETESAAMKRPLKIVDGIAYAASWVPVRITENTEVVSKGKAKQLPRPKITEEVRLVVVRSDGAIFGYQDDLTLATIGFPVHLPETLPVDLLWHSQAVQNYSNGYRPVPIVVFERLVEIVSKFIDFGHSLADQRTMSEFIACYILATWFLDAFDVIGFLWPNGERGSGKTNLLNVVASLSYLGQVILSGGTYATLRDLADYGATLAFDDAEIFSDPRKSDPEKRTLLLAGNRRGATVPLKEPVGKREWRTRYVNTYCARLFSSIHLPDPVLASRTIIVPLTRSTDRTRTNIDPADPKEWPYPRREMVDDLWALALHNLTNVEKNDEVVGTRSSLNGRSLQPWRGVLAIAAWLEGEGMVGLFQRIEHLAIGYQSERASMETSDLTVLVIRAVLDSAVSAIRAKSAFGYIPDVLLLTATQVTEKAQSIARQDELDIDPDWVTPKRVGRVMAALRLIEQSRPGGKGPRRRLVTKDDLRRLADGYGVELPPEIKQYLSEIGEDPGIEGSNGTKGPNGSVNSKPL